jgi:hypothetical protein
MSEGNKDLFGKIDALFEKRAPDALVDKGLEHEDFPLLTDVIGTAQPAPMTWGEPERRVLDRRASNPGRRGRRNEERRLGDRREADQPGEPPPRPKATKDEVEQLVQAVELRLADLFIRQQLRMEEAVRRVIREEMEAQQGKHREE